MLSSRCLPPRVAFAALAALLAAAPAAAQPRERVESTLPSAQPGARGDRVLGTAAQREAGEARFRESLERQAELDALFNPHRAAWGGMAVPVYPTVVPPWGAVAPGWPDGALPPGAKVPLPCLPGACPPPRPSPRPTRPIESSPGPWSGGGSSPAPR